jgi:DNA-binding NarL/FixJ family response regulator
MIKVLIVDEQEFIRFAIRVVLERNENIQVCGEVATEAEAIKLIKYSTPDIVLVDIGFPNDSGIEVTRKIKKLSPHIKIIVFNAQVDETLVKDAFAAGADSYCTNKLTKEKLIEVVDTTYKGEIWIDPAIGKIVIQNMQPQPVQFKIKNVCSLTKALLTSRETEILEMIASGQRNRQIAQNLHLSVGTVRSHVHRILGKLDCESRGQAAIKAITEGLVDNLQLEEIRLPA